MDNLEAMVVMEEKMVAVVAILVIMELILLPGLM